MLDHPLYQSVLAKPADNTPRLIMADWLDELGDPYAGLIRAQVGLAEIDGHQAVGHQVAEQSRLLLRERVLMNEHQLVWMARIHEALGQKTSLRIGRNNGIREIGFVRGFIGSIRLRADDWLQSHPQLQQLFPIESLCAIGASADFRQDRSPDLIRNVRQLSIRSTQDLDLNHLQHLVVRDDLNNLLSLALVNIFISPRFADRLIESVLNDRAQLVLENCYMEQSVAEKLIDRFGDKIVINNHGYMYQPGRPAAGATTGDVVRQQPHGLSQMLRRWVFG